MALAEEALTLGAFEGSYPLRYHLALAYAKAGRVEDAFSHITVVLRESPSVNLRAHTYALLAEPHHPMRPHESHMALDAGLALIEGSDILTARAVIAVAVLKYGSAAQRARTDPLLRAIDRVRLPAYLTEDVEAALATALAARAPS